MTDDKHPHRGPYNAFCACLLILVLLAGTTALMLYLIYRPNKPQFTVISATITTLNTTSPPPFISTAMQFTVVTRNPNKRVSIHYDHLSAIVTYKNQHITSPVMLPPLTHEKHSQVVFSPVLGGVMPLSAEVADGLVADEAYGVLWLRLVVMGRLRWKAGIVRTRHYGVHVNCDTYLEVKNGHLGQVPLLTSPKCKVDI